jgi:Kelch motif
MHAAVIALTAFAAAFITVISARSGSWGLIKTKGLPVARHEACFVFVNGKGYLLGGRKLRPVSEFNPASNTWTTKRFPPQGETHHMQCVAYKGKIWIAGGWKGSGTEVPHTTMFVYDPVTDTWDNSRPYLPNNPERRRGGAAFVLNGDMMFLSHGNIGGHGEQATTQKLFDQFNPATGEWKIMPDAINARDHTGGAMVGGRMCVAGGRDGGVAAFFNSPILPTDCYNFTSRKWVQEANIPNPGRAGVMVARNCEGQMMVAGGEGFGKAYSQVDIFNGKSWTTSASMVEPRHGSGLGIGDCSCGIIYTASGNNKQGGSSESNTTEMFVPTNPLPGCASTTTIPPSTGLRMRVQPAGNAPPGLVLTSGANICPTNFAGFTIVCENVPAGTTKVTFTINGILQRTEGSAPYAIAGDSNGSFTNWKPVPPGPNDIACIPNVGPSLVLSKVSFTC